jgi:hypothetical protein
MLTFIWIAKIQAGVILDILYLLFAILYLGKAELCFPQNLKSAPDASGLKSKIALHFILLFCILTRHC